MCPDPTFRLRYCLCVQVNYMYLFTFFHLMCPALLCGPFVLFCGPFDVSWSYIFFHLMCPALLCGPFVLFCGPFNVSWSYIFFFILCVPLFFVARLYYFVARSMCPDPTFRLTLRLRYCFGLLSLRWMSILYNNWSFNIKLIPDHFNVIAMYLHAFYTLRFIE